MLSRGFGRYASYSSLFCTNLDEDDLEMILNETALQ